MELSLKPLSRFRGPPLWVVNDWNQSSVFNLVEDPSGSTASKDRRACNPTSGMIRICNLKYGRNGWLGIAGIAVNSDDHILYGYTKLNDSYLNSNYLGGYYNDAEWRQSVACQELGHDFGLGHWDEDFTTYTDSCMDYRDPPFMWSSQADWLMLDTIYDHWDLYNTYYEDGGGGCNAPPGKGCNKSGVPQNNGDIGWGMSLGRRGGHENVHPDRPGWHPPSHARALG